MMIPYLSTPDLPEDHRRKAELVLPPPRRFRPLAGQPRSVQLGSQQTGQSGFGPTAAQKAGIRYEAKAQVHLAALLPHYRVAPHIFFEDDDGWRYVVPDGLLIQPRATFVFEIKVRHMADSWWQLRKLYVPVLEALDPRVPVVPIEVCQSYDPAIEYPEAVQMIEDLETVVKATEWPKVIHVWTWRP
jgi:hypothetical protein